MQELNNEPKAKGYDQLVAENEAYVQDKYGKLEDSSIALLGLESFEYAEFLSFQIENQLSDLFLNVKRFVELSAKMQYSAQRLGLDKAEIPSQIKELYMTLVFLGIT